MPVYSDNGGATWSSAAAISTETTLQGSQPMYLPNGNCVVVYWNFGTNQQPGERLEAVISTDGGQSLGRPNFITFATEYKEPSIRTGSFLPSAAADRTTQNIYVVYQTLLGGNPRIAFTKSTDAGLIGARRLQLVIILRAWGCSIRPSMFHQMVRRSRLPFM